MFILLSGMRTDSLGRLCRHCAQPVTIWLHYLSPTKFEKFCGARCLPNLLGFEPATLLRMSTRGPRTNIKTPEWAFEYWLWCVGETRANYSCKK